MLRFIHLSAIIAPIAVEILLVSEKPKDCNGKREIASKKN